MIHGETSTALERIAFLGYMHGFPMVRTSEIRQGEVALCRCGKILRYAPFNMEGDDEDRFDETRNVFVILGEEYDLMIMNEIDYRKMRAAT